MNYGGWFRLSREGRALEFLRARQSSSRHTYTHKLTDPTNSLGSVSLWGGCDKAGLPSPQNRVTVTNFVPYEPARLFSYA